MLGLTIALALAAAPTEAEQLFSDGRAALQRGQTALACDLFARSHHLQPTLGVLLNLANCLEQQGRLGSAWLRFNEASAWAHRTHEAPREQFALQRAAALKPRVSWLAVSVGSDVEVIIDHGEPQQLRAASPTSVPVDTGSHAVEARASGFEVWATSVTVDEQGATAFVKVPPLKALPAPAGSPFVEAPAPQPPPVLVQVTAPRTVQAVSPVGLALLVSGGVVAVAGGVGLIWSTVTYDILQGQRATLLAPDPRVSRETFDQLAWVIPASFAALGVGVAAAATGLVLTLHGSPAVVTPVLQPGGGGVIFSGAF